jgi:hypothetical protein
MATGAVLWTIGVGDAVGTGVGGAGVAVGVSSTPVRWSMSSMRASPVRLSIRAFSNALWAST